MAMRYYAPFPSDRGEPARPRGPHSLRIGDAERDAAAADLGEHYAAGRLTLDELHERLDAVFSAKTFGQLSRTMADLPAPRRLLWRAGPDRLAGTVAGPADGFYRNWGPAGFPFDGHPGTGGRAWHTANPATAGFRSREPEPEPPTPSDRAGKFAALSLLLLAMLIWLFTALLFATHGFYHPVGQVQPANGHYQTEQQVSEGTSGQPGGAP